MAKAMDVQVVVASRVKEVMKKHDMRSDGSLAEAVNDKVVEMLQDAVKRAQENKRSTVRPYDL